jgi:serine/threonine protein kinase
LPYHGIIILKSEYNEKRGWNILKAPRNFVFVVSFFVPTKMSNWEEIHKTLIGRGTNGMVYVCHEPIHFSSGKCWQAKGRVVKRLLKSKHRKAELRNCKRLAGGNFKHLVNTLAVEKSLGLILFETRMDIDLFDYIHGGTTTSKILRSSDSPEVARQKALHLLPLLKQVTRGLMELHEFGMAHMDLKLENVLYSPKNKTIKLCDFAYATPCEFSTDFKGTIDYIAPEICLEVLYEPKKADIYSLGILMFMALVGSYPDRQNKLDECESLDEIYAIKSEGIQFPPWFPFPRLKHLILSLTHLNPRERITLEECITHLNKIYDELNAKSDNATLPPPTAIIDCIVAP